MKLQWEIFSRGAIHIVETPFPHFIWMQIVHIFYISFVSTLKIIGRSQAIFALSQLKIWK